MERVIVSINIAVGTLLVALTLSFALFEDNPLSSKALEGSVEAKVAEIMQQEKALLQSFNRPFVLFGAGESSVSLNGRVFNLEDLKSSGYLLDAYRTADGALVVRAKPSEDGLKKGGVLDLVGLVRPRLYQARFDPVTRAEKKGWDITVD